MVYALIGYFHPHRPFFFLAASEGHGQRGSDVQSSLGAAVPDGIDYKFYSDEVRASAHAHDPPFCCQGFRFISLRHFLHAMVDS
jgi:hypothetical protein